MYEGFFWALLGVVWVFFWAIIWLLRRKRVEANSLRLRELVHQERLAAIEKGVPLPELPSEEESDPIWLRPEAERMRANWLRRIALLLGLFFLFGGLGVCVGFYFAPDRSFHVMWTIGFIPALSGIGLLLYTEFASRRDVDPAAPEP